MLPGKEGRGGAPGKEEQRAREVRLEGPFGLCATHVTVGKNALMSPLEPDPVRRIKSILDAAKDAERGGERGKRLKAHGCAGHQGERPVTPAGQPGSSRCL